MTSLQTTDTQVEQAMGRLLRWGVILSATVVLIGGVLYLRQHGDDPTHYATFHGNAPELRTLSGTLSAAAAGDGRAIIQVGLLLLVATPVARVAFSIMVFARQRDARYVFVTIVVLTVLCYSLLHGYLEQHQ